MTSYDTFDTGIPLQQDSLTEAELATLPRGGKSEKKQLLQLFKSRNFDRKPAAGRPPAPFNYKFDGDVLSIRGKINLKTDDVSSTIVKLKELIVKLEAL